MADTGLYIGPDNAPDRYRLLRSIGRGGEAVLYLAELELSGATEPVVVKMLDARQTLSQEMFTRISEKWREQAELLRFVHRLGVVGMREHFEGPSAHPAGGAPHGVDTGPGRALYLVMNHVEGLDLRDWRAERTLDTPAERREAVRCLEQLADVLDWLHSGAGTPSGRTVVHGDLSPGNVMIDANGQATLVDFGLSKLTADHQTAEVWFTPGFAAPEVFEGKRTPASDRYAFGAIAYFLLSGASPATMPETLRAALLDLPELAPLDPDKAARIAAIVATDPANRPDSLAAWVKELRPAVISTTTRPPLPIGKPTPAPPSTPPAPLTPPPPAHAPGAVAPTTADPVVPAVPSAPPTPALPPATPPAPVHAPVHTPPPAYAPAPPARVPAARPVPAEAAAPAAEPAAEPVPVPEPPPVPRPRTEAKAVAEPPAAQASAPAPAPTATPTPTPAPAPAPDREEAADHDPESAPAAHEPPSAPLPDRTKPTLPLGSGGLPPAAGSPGGGGSGDGTPRRRSRKPQVIGALVVAVLLVAGGVAAGVALSGNGDGHDTAGGSHPSAPASGPSAVTSTTPAAPLTPDDTATATDSQSPGATPTMSAGQREMLGSETPADDNSSLTTQNAEVNGKQYYDALVTEDCYGGYAEYNLGRQWSTFSVTAGVDDSGKNLPVEFTILADGNQLFHQQVTLGNPVQKTFDVSGALRLRVEWAVNDNGDGCATGVLGDPTLVH
ncbi:protein kinase domain-containing protein [Actinacidiphila acididurans]|uniref:Protein kinase n=1 Tax=Actinacidiphila acididurans TaxID=2784346 RepID=A0ABS2TPG5_9ACTN|nr:protein kinase [Actinacidiphila acididurans]MBM9503843.1 protein kinase [Actinacidiphila acididurans]